MKKIALLEYDHDTGAVIPPDHEKFPIRLPEIAVLAFVGDEVDAFADEHHATVAAEFISITKKYPIYVLMHHGREICLCQAPCGAAPATMIVDFLIAYGVRKILSTGSCGVLADLPENYFLVPVRALRDEGTSFHYLPPSRFVDLNPSMTDAVTAYFAAHGIEHKTCVVWTTDGFYRETRAKVIARREEGCDAVDMECAALAACASFRGAEFGQFFFTADSLNAVDAYDERGWGMDSLRPALKLAVDIAATV